MALLQRVARCMEKIAPLKLAESAWDNVGTLIETPIPRENASRVFLTIDLTQPVLEEALKDPKVGVIVSYHPPLFKSFKRLCLDDEKQAIALKCVASGVSVFAPHTSLDNCHNGINDWLAKGLGKGETTVINVNANAPQGHEGAGSGRIHKLETPATIEELVTRIKKHLKIEHVRLSTPHKFSGKISTVGICAGSGASILGGLKTDLYFTGEMSHHEVLAAVADNACVILCEHTNTERGFLSDVLQDKLTELLKEEGGSAVDVVVSQIDCDPLRVV
ncbi:GTP cyclohydrolase 1 type 2/Nif3 [Phlyctochytrium arcticum]|nr:GTP cyclohydrolase 1 type 2/Nif3 [Phlyctochytrium arcticum]